MLFLNVDDHEQTASLLQAMAGLEAQFEAANATVIAINTSSDATQNKVLKRATRFPWPIVSDPSGGFFASYGLHKGHEPANRLVMITPYRQIRAWFDLDRDASATLRTIMDLLDNAQTAEELRAACADLDRAQCFVGRGMRRPCKVGGDRHAVHGAASATGRDFGQL